MLPYSRKVHEGEEEGESEAAELLGLPGQGEVSRQGRKIHQLEASQQEKEVIFSCPTLWYLFYLFFFQE